jgi:hypothetical protein
MLRVERHLLGPRWYLLGQRVHEYQLGLAIRAANGVLLASELVGISPITEISALLGGWLVAKDWRDVFPGKRDTAAWRLGIHKPPDPPAWQDSETS